MIVSESLEDYLETILVLQQRKGTVPVSYTHLCILMICPRTEYIAYSHYT